MQAYTRICALHYVRIYLTKHDMAEPNAQSANIYMYIIYVYAVEHTYV